MEMLDWLEALNKSRAWLETNEGVLPKHWFYFYDGNFKVQNSKFSRNFIPVKCVPNLPTISYFGWKYYNWIQRAPDS